MTGKTHAAVGVASTAALIMLYPTGFVINDVHIVPLVSLITAATGSYLPDIDIHQSALGQKHKFISKHLKHRGFTHTLVIPLILCICMEFISAFAAQYAAVATIINSLLFGLIFGWLLHIFADMFNKKGVPLFYPFLSSHIHIATVKTRHWSESVWLVLYIGCLVALVYTQGGHL